MSSGRLEEEVKDFRVRSRSDSTAGVVRGTPPDHEDLYAPSPWNQSGRHHRRDSASNPGFPGGGLSQGHQQEASKDSTVTSRTLTSPLFYSEDIPPMKDEDVRDMRWVGFVTLVDHQGGQYRSRSSAPTAFGGFSDIWQCDTRFFDGSTAVVAVKKLRAVKLPPGLDKSQTSKKLLGRLKKELRVWMRLRHRNVAPLLGFTFDEEIAIISPWFGHGNVSDYLAAHPEADRMKLVQGVAAGLEHLHSSSPVVVHGDMKPDNVLIDQLGCPRIIDFGLSKIVEEDPSLSSFRSASLREAGNARWIAPELLLEEGASRSRQTDMFSFGCVALFIFTGDVPFKGTLDGQLVIARYKGASPIQDGATYPNLETGSALMEVLRACWNLDPQGRPEIGDVVKLLNPAHPGSGPSAVSKTAVESPLQRNPAKLSVPLIPLQSGVVQQGQSTMGKRRWAFLWTFLRELFTFKRSKT